MRLVILFFLPLVASWMLMLTEGPILQGVIARLSDATASLAAFGLIVALQVTIESPIINLLTTSTALAKSVEAYGVLRRFMWHINGVLTAIALLLAFTPLFDLLLYQGMGVQEAIAEKVRPGMKIMVLWSAAIGWRRFNQGILIRFGQTRYVGWGSAIRLGASGGSAILFALLTSWPGVVIGASALLAGVLLEAVCAHLWVRQTVRRYLTRGSPEACHEEAPSYRDVVAFHMPLASTSVLSLLIQPIVAAGLARMNHPTQNLAAWPVAYNILLFFRSFGFAVPETIIALQAKEGASKVLRQFTLALGFGVTLLCGLFAFSPWSRVYLERLLKVDPGLVDFVLSGIQIGCLIPTLHIVQSWFRGWLVAQRKPGDVYRGMAIHLGLVGIGIFAAISLEGPSFLKSGVPMAFGLMTVSMVAEGIYLRRRVRELGSSE